MRDEAKPEAVPAKPVSDTDLDGSIKRLRKYVGAGSLIHAASSYRTEDGVLHLIEFDDLRAVLDVAATTSQPVQVEVTEASVTVLAKHMANAASDWNHNDCGDDDHPLEHSNWEAYTDDARRALVAALGGGDQ